MTACQRTEDPPPATPAPVEITADAVRSAVLSAGDVGDGWTAEEGATPSTVQIGGKVGPANVKESEVSATTAFAQDEGTGYVTNSIFLLSTEEVARAYLAEHREADDKTSWVQERKDGGGARYERTGQIGNLPSLGDEMYSAKIDAFVTEGDAEEVERDIEYVAYRIDRVLAFVVAQDVGVGAHVRKQERKLTNLTG